MDEQLKQRVVGAAVLVVAGVVFIPMILHGPPTDEAVAGRPPVAVNPGAAATADRFSSSIVPVDGRARPPSSGRTASRRPAGPTASPPAGSPTSTSASVAETTRRHEVAVAPRPGDWPTVPAQTSDATEGDRSGEVRGWAVQLGAFSHPGNALALRDRLKAKGYRAFVESSREDGRKVTRVLVGPSPSRPRAREQLAALRKATTLNGILVRYPK